MNKLPHLLLGVLVLALMPLHLAAAWYWPFGYDEDSTNAPPRLHRLLEKANEYIEIAEEEAMKGDAEKAIENYKLAVEELDRVEMENPERAESTEFAPLRNRRATCTGAIDAIRFAQVNENERAVTVTNTDELQKKWRKKHGLQTPEEKSAEEKSLRVEEEKQEKIESGVDDVVLEHEVKRTPELATETPAGSVVAPTTAPVPPVFDNSFNGRYRQALSEVRAKDYAAADLLLEKLLEENPNDLNVLLLRAAAQMGTGSHFAARRTLERAMRTHPKSYLPYYNLAYLLLKMGEDAEMANQYYELGRTIGKGPQDPALEKRIKDLK